MCIPCSWSLDLGQTEIHPEFWNPNLIHIFYFIPITFLVDMSVYSNMTLIIVWKTVLIFELKWFSLKTSYWKWSPFFLDYWSFHGSIGSNRERSKQVTKRTAILWQRTKRWKLKSYNIFVAPAQYIQSSCSWTQDKVW